MVGCRDLESQNTKLHQGTRETIDQALPRFEKAIEIDPDFASAYAMAAWCHCWPSLLLATAVLAASHAPPGRTAEAQRATDHLRELDPNLRLSTLTSWLPIQRPENLAILVDGLRRAGLPE